MFFVVLSTLLLFTQEGVFGDPIYMYPTVKPNQTYDYIVVGAGSAGAVVASRLSEDPNNKVAVMEAGGIPASITDMPYKCFQIEGQPGTDWMYVTEKQNNTCQAFPGQRCYWSRYKGLGGCSTHNTMLYVRGSHNDYDNWAENMGAAGWSWAECEPFFKKSENNTMPANMTDEGYHGNSGPVTVSESKYNIPLYDVILETGKYQGLNSVDYNGKSQIGCSPIQLTQRDGRRCGTEKAFLRPAADRDNLHILMNAQVVKVLFDTSVNPPRAYGVQFTQNNQTMQVNATKEIVLSCGAIGTPHLLLLSGVGPKENLQENNIPVISDLPVGKNMQDQIHVALSYGVDSGAFLASAAMQDCTSTADQYVNGKGPFTTPNAIGTMCFLNTSKDAEGPEWPDLQLIPICTSFDVTNPHYSDENQLTMIVMLVRPDSRGYMKLLSNDYTVPPYIQPNFMSNQSDIEKMKAAINLTMDFMNAPPMQKLNPKYLNNLVSCTGYNYSTPEFLNCSATYGGQTSLHMAGTARMGAPNDTNSVVDPRLRVIGCQGLRVADTSVMPLIVTGNTNAAAMMIGERAADMILKDATATSTQ